MKHKIYMSFKPNQACSCVCVCALVCASVSSMRRQRTTSAHHTCRQARCCSRQYLWRHVSTGWRGLIGSPKLQIIFHQRATKYRSLLRKMTYKDKGSYQSSPPCICMRMKPKYVCILMSVFSLGVCVSISVYLTLCFEGA